MDRHSFLRVLFLSNGDYLLIGPAELKDRDISRHVESELWVMDREARTPPRRLGRRLFEGCGVSTLAPRLTYSMNGHHDSRLAGRDNFEVHVTEIDYGREGPRLGLDKVIYSARDGLRPEPQDFRHRDTEVIMAEYVNSPRTHPQD